MKYCIMLVAAGLIALVVVNGRAPAQTRAGGALPQGLDAEINDFWQKWEGDKPSEAIRRAAPNADGQQAWAPIGQAADEFQFRAGGRCLGHSEVTRKAMSDRMEYVSYLALYEPSPMRVQLLYYKAKDKWSAVGLHIDSNTTRWMEEVNAIQVVPETPADE
jgi:hypothetical protein